MTGLTTIGYYPAKDILAQVGTKKFLEIDICGNKIKVKLNSLRLKTFKNNPKCRCCQREGTLIGVDIAKGQEKPHFNLYCVEANGNKILMTKDHITPKSKGGKNVISNMQTMCTECNSRKKDMTPEEYKQYLKQKRKN